MNSNFPIDEEIDFSDFFVESPEKNKDKTPMKPQGNKEILEKIIGIERKVDILLTLLTNQNQ